MRIRPLLVAPFLLAALATTDWDAESRDAQEALGNVDRATQPGGDTLGR